MSHETIANITPPGANYLNTPRGWRSWIFSLDHKRIGVMYLALTSLAFLAGGILAMIIRSN